MIKCRAKQLLRQLMAGQFLTALNLAKKVNLSYPTVRRCVSGGIVSLETAKAICDYFGKPFDDLFELENINEK